MSKHTLGPWTPHDGAAYTYGGESFPAWHIEAQGGYRIGSISNFNGNPENEANARLIAAAPEMLEALQLARDYINAELIHRQEAYDGYPHKWATERADLLTVDAVIAKATGEKK